MVKNHKSEAITLKRKSNGFNVFFRNKKYPVDYQKKYWNALSPEMKGFFSENMTYLSTMHLNQMLGIKELKFNFKNPFLASYFYRAFFKHAPFSADSGNRTTAFFMKGFLNNDYTYERGDDFTVPRMNEAKPSMDAVINFTFGKDSLITAAIANELDMDYILSFMISADYPLEYKYRKPMMKRFSKEFKKEIVTIYDGTAKMHNEKYWRIKYNEWNIGHLITFLAMVQVPLITHYKAKYIFLGNENDCSLNYINKDGYRSYPVYDQSAEWMMELKKIMGLITPTRCNVASLVEPLSDLGIMHILHNRYSDMSKYQMSCFPDDSYGGKDNYWCHHCTKCARIFILAKALGFDPKRFGIKDEMLSIRHKHYFSAFGASKSASAYDMSGVGRDEQLYAFYLAYKKGATGYLIDLFRKKYLARVKEREDELYKKFFTVRDSITLPKKLKRQVESIFNEELGKVRV